MFGSCFRTLAVILVSDFLLFFGVYVCVCVRVLTKKCLTDRYRNIYNNNKKHKNTGRSIIKGSKAEKLEQVSTSVCLPRLSQVHTVALAHSFNVACHGKLAQLSNNSRTDHVTHVTGLCLAVVISTKCRYM